MKNVNAKEALVCAQSCASANVRRASRAVTRLYGEFLADVASNRHDTLLVACSLAEGATVSKLAKVFAMERSALTRNLAVMERRGLVDVRPGKDRRTRTVALTTAGQAAFAKLIRVGALLRKELSKRSGWRDFSASSRNFAL